MARTTNGHPALATMPASMPPEVIQVLESSLLFNYISHIYSVEREAGTVRKDESRRTTPKQEIHSPKKLRPLNNLKQEAFRACRSYGTKLDALGVWLVPAEDAFKLRAVLRDISVRWNEFVTNELVPNYKTWIKEFAKQHSVFSADILGLAPSLADVRESTRFVYTSLPVKAETIDSNNLEAEVYDLPSQAIHEIASEFRDCGFAKSVTFTQALRSILVRTQRKAGFLRCLHPRMAELADVLDRLIVSLPITGKIVENDALAVRAVVDCIMNPKLFMERGFGVAVGALDLPREPAQLALPAVAPQVVPDVRSQRTDMSRILAQGDRIRDAARRVIGSQNLSQPNAMDDQPVDDDPGFARERRRPTARVVAQGTRTPTNWN